MSIFKLFGGKRRVRALSIEDAEYAMDNGVHVPMVVVECQCPYCSKPIVAMFMQMKARDVRGKEMETECQDCSNKFTIEVR